MEQNNSVIITYKYYDDRKRRVAIMAKKLPLEHMEITIITCSRKDAFNKKFARTMLTSMEGAVTIHPKKVILSHAGKFKDTFFNWCNDNYYKMRHGYVSYQTTEIIRGSKVYTISVENVSKIVKNFGW